MSAIPGLGEIQVLLQLFSQMTYKLPEAERRGALLYAPRREEQYNRYLYFYPTEPFNYHAIMRKQTRKKKQ